MRIAFRFGSGKCSMSGSSFIIQHSIFPPMYSSWQVAKKYIHYYLTASNGRGHGVHSPFVYDFIRNVLMDKSNYPAYQQVESLRSALKQDETIIEVDDFGAGSGMDKTKQRSIASIARYAAKSPKLAQLLFRIVHYYRPEHILELGTSLGISTAYMSLANPDACIITAEGSPAIAARAIKNFQSLQCSSIELVQGNFDDSLPPLLSKLPVIDLAFIDGNHRLQPTLRYFDQLLANTGKHSIIILDDIHWSAEMEQAWSMIRQHPDVRVTIDLFFIGLVFLRDEFHVKQHFTIRF
jgi:predicted O-methyltransferase YrrM